MIITGTVCIDPINDNHPVFGHTSYTASIDEDADLGDPVTQVQATDDDSADTEDGQITYAFKATAPSEFQVIFTRKYYV